MIVESRSQLGSLIEINQKLVETLAPDELLKRIRDSLMNLFFCEACSIALIDEEEGTLAFTTITGNIETPEFRLPLGQGIAGWVVETGRPVLQNDVSQDPRWYAGVDQRTGFKTQSVLCAPLELDRRVIGVIQVLNTAQSHGFQESDLEVFAAFARLAATAIDRCRTVNKLSSVNQALLKDAEDRYGLIVGDSAAMREIIETLRAAAATKTTVLLLGESGVGKEVLARSIHRWSPRADGPFVAVNCVALAPELMESELFGHQKGAFTGAIEEKMGKFELANGGTLFLDEIADLAPNLQAKLLRALQEREFQRVGGVKDIRTDVRVVAASNRDLRQAMADGSFREDLYYRLNVVSVTIPPLRERKEDLPLLIERFVDRFAREMNRQPLRMNEPARALLLEYDWPGNVRELQNAIERAVVLSSADTLGEGDLPSEIRGRRVGSQGAGSAGEDIYGDLSLNEAVEAFRVSRIRRALDSSGGNQTEAAKLLGMSQPNLSRLMKTLGMRKEGSP